jgi:hypothetical protein
MMAQPLLKMRNNYLKILAMINGAHEEDKEKKTFHRRLHLESTPPSKEIIRWT